MTTTTAAATALPRPQTAAKRGAYYKARARKYLQSQGFQVADLEVVRWLHPPGRDPIPVKRDQFGSDLLAVSGTDIVFCQIKGGKTWKQGVSKAKREFARFTFPPTARQWIICWPVRSRQPEIIEIERALL